jgi:hypothetical protein
LRAVRPSESNLPCASVLTFGWNDQGVDRHEAGRAIGRRPVEIVTRSPGGAARPVRRAGGRRSPRRSCP